MVTVAAARVAAAAAELALAELGLTDRDFVPSCCSCSSSCFASAFTSAASSWNFPVVVLAFAPALPPSATTSVDSLGWAGPSAAACDPSVTTCPSLAPMVLDHIPPLCF